MESFHIAKLRQKWYYFYTRSGGKIPKSSVFLAVFLLFEIERKKELIRMESWLEAGGENKFTKIKDLTKRTQERGISVFKLSIGQPIGPALLSAREAASDAVMSKDESMHEYQDNDSLGVTDFAKRFIECHAEIRPGSNLEYFPIPGIKSVLQYVLLACNLHKTGGLVATMTEPGYPVPAYWANVHGIQHYALPTNPENDFIFSADDIRPGTKLLMLNYPHNPSGQGMTEKQIDPILARCEEEGIRVCNDAAYGQLRHDPKVKLLMEVAPKFRYLEHLELTSASKAIGNGTGWRVGAAVGTPAFTGDVKTIKSNADSGFVAFAAAGALAALENDMESIISLRKSYERRILILSEIMGETGMKLACVPKAGFFTLWQTPTKAFGERIQNAEHFNQLVIENTGIIEVDFDPFIRAAVVEDIENPTNQQKIADSFKKAKVSY